MASPAAPEPQPQPQPAAPEPQPQALFSLPADVELLDYLRRWIEGGAAAVPAWVREAAVYDHEPSELMLPATATTAADGGLAWYFVTQLRHLGPHDPRIRRTAGGGTWKIEHDQPLASEPVAVHLGVKRSLSFAVRDAYGRYDRTGHLMREYLLGGDAGHVPGGELALCVLYHTPRGDDLAAAKALDKALQRIRVAEEKKAAKSRKQEMMAAAKAAKSQERLAAREAIKASKAQHRASLKAAAAAAIRAAKASAPPAAAPAPAPPVAAPAPAPPAAAPTSAAGPTDALPTKGKKRAAAKELKRAAAKELKRATAKEAEKALATASSATANAPSPPKRLLLLQVGIKDNKVYGAQHVEDGPPFKKVKPIDCTGWVLLGPQTKDNMTGGPCATA